MIGMLESRSTSLATVRATLRLSVRLQKQTCSQSPLSSLKGDERLGRNDVMVKVAGQAGKVAPCFSSGLPAKLCVLVKSPQE